MRFFAGETELDAGPGDFVLLPKSVPHTFVVGAEPLHALQLTTPAGFEDFAAAVGLPAQHRDPRAPARSLRARGHPALVSDVVAAVLAQPDDFRDMPW